jgi:hypothetical protein
MDAWLYVNLCRAHAATCGICIPRWAHAATCGMGHQARDCAWYDSRRYVIYHVRRRIVRRLKKIRRFVWTCVLINSSLIFVHTSAARFSVYTRHPMMRGLAADRKRLIKTSRYDRTDRMESDETCTCSAKLSDGHLRVRTKRQSAWLTCACPRQTACTTILSEPRPFC